MIVFRTRPVKPNSGIQFSANRAMSSPVASRLGLAMSLSLDATTSGARLAGRSFLLAMFRRGDDAILFQFVVRRKFRIGRGLAHGSQRLRAAAASESTGRLPDRWAALPAVGAYCRSR